MICLWWLITLLGLIIVVEILIIARKKRLDEKAEVKANSFALPLLALATILLPSGAWIIIAIEILVIAILLAYIIYIYLHWEKKENVLEEVMFAPIVEVVTPPSEEKLVDRQIELNYSLTLTVNTRKVVSGENTVTSTNEQRYICKGNLNIKGNIQGDSLVGHGALDPKTEQPKLTEAGRKELKTSINNEIVKWFKKR